MKALIIVDVQHDFLPGGALAVPKGDEVIAVINELQAHFDYIIATQDWHPADHGSFAANHEGKKPGEIIDLAGTQQILWPVHCVQGSQGADFADTLDKSKWQKVFRKGQDPKIDSYSGFFDNGRGHDTGLGDYLKSIGITDVFITGLAADYCVKFTALDAQSLGFETTLFRDATRAVNLQPDDFEKALADMKAAGINIITKEDYLH
ncbi:bifunctional nicotinamidase/pyrazinamidase [Penaeicola halotolerans]|uniref:bifunctional nicotinamidase/pyrazinamidase n=1 Tax=Penaeicola halotolerans TaxID=2793196 RepID=UPI001CF802B8|nr:bifunctional nicotinamidase/pyrazinamidase [Penaeicola halotolerans]